MWIVLAIALFAGWLLFKLVVGVTSFAIHLLVVAAVVALVVHFARRVGSHRASPQH